MPANTVTLMQKIVEVFELITFVSKHNLFTLITSKTNFEFKQNCCMICKTKSEFHINAIISKIEYVLTLLYEMKVKHQKMWSLRWCDHWIEIHKRLDTTIFVRSWPTVGTTIFVRSWPTVKWKEQANLTFRWQIKQTTTKNGRWLHGRREHTQWIVHYLPKAFEFMV